MIIVWLHPFKRKICITKQLVQGYYYELQYYFASSLYTLYKYIQFAEWNYWKKKKKKN